MNFRSIIFLVVVLILSGCGVKSDPIAPPDSFQLLDPSAKYQYVPKTENVEVDDKDGESVKGKLIEAKDSD